MVDPNLDRAERRRRYEALSYYDRYSLSITPFKWVVEDVDPSERIMELIEDAIQSEENSERRGKMVFESRELGRKIGITKKSIEGYEESPSNGNAFEWANERCLEIRGIAIQAAYRCGVDLNEVLGPGEPNGHGVGINIGSIT
tara:strand:- start:4636 stop:5064 length:429 start_codon:yes stop_codon:yes gene_type:complete